MTRDRDYFVMYAERKTTFDLTELTPSQLNLLCAGMEKQVDVMRNAIGVKDLTDDQIASIRGGSDGPAFQYKEARELFTTLTELHGDYEVADVWVNERRS